ncbi:hypothetical protein SADUNF_Sadunf02G0204800 [Salix dunnii]|uniref:Leucine-rich repeat-containing N-terminal plant-type domain-containing protein n=1 Tax=Salix dunnii TaxID=1413687 RepID=A0A835N9F9_9ROSI|nr:hypothetical protein SADUNF_Sadunf02G0204800 [Salix dunnii]
MACFLACFGSSKERKRRRHSKVQPRVHRKEGYGSPVESTVSVVKDCCPEKPIVSPVSDIRDDGSEEKLSLSTRKKVTFNSNVTTYDHVSVEESTDFTLGKEDGGDKREGKEENSAKPIQSQSSSEDSSIASSLCSYPPPNHRYQNCRDSDDELGCEESDLDESDEEEENGGLDYDDVYEDDEIAESRSRMTKLANEENDRDVMISGLSGNRNFRGRRAAVLNPVENLSQWKIVKAKGKPPSRQQKENLTLDQEPRISFSSEPGFKELAFSFKAKAGQCNKKPDQEIAVDASLSNWLGSSECTPVNKPGSIGLDAIAPEKSMSQGSNSPRSFDDRPILGALTVEELKQLSATSSRRSPSRSPDEMPIIGTVGTYWNHNGSGKDSGSASSYKGIPNTTSKYREDKRVNWHSTPFETRLERALNGGDAARTYSAHNSIGNISKLSIVKNISLQNNQMSGRVPESIAILSKDILHLLLANSTIPLEPGLCTNLTSLDLVGKQLNGGLPLSLSSLAKIHMGLSENSLSEIGNLKELSNLDLSGNQISGPLPPTLWNLTNLRILDLFFNNIDGKMPPEVGNLTMLQLQTLDLNTNQLHGELPQTISNITSSTSISLFGNDFYGSIPNDLGKAPGRPLVFVIIKKTIIVKQTIQGCARLEARSSHRPRSKGSCYSGLRMHTNQARGLAHHAFVAQKLSSRTQAYLVGPMDLVIISKMELVKSSARTQAEALIQWRDTLSFSTPPLTSWSRSNLHNLCRWTAVSCNPTSRTVSRINLSSLNITGTLARFNFTPFTDLTGFDIQNNNVSGTIPLAIGSLSKLNYLDLSANLFEGSIPVEISRLAELQYLSLYNNNLAGAIPFQLASLPKVRHLDLGANCLENPDWSKFSMPSLEYLSFSLNELTSEFPGFITNCRNLTGQIPESIGSISGLQIADLFNNSFQGNIPSSIGQLKHLQKLDLRTNALNSTIPPELGLCTNLTYLALAVNKLSGELPLSLSNLSKLTDMDLSENSLSGKISPTLISNWTELTSLQVQNNLFSGNIPPEIGKLTRL